MRELWKEDELKILSAEIQLSDLTENVPFFFKSVQFKFVVTLRGWWQKQNASMKMKHIIFFFFIQCYPDLLSDNAKQMY